MMLAWLLAGFIVGLVARRTVSLPDATPDLINAYIIRLALPAVILLRVPALSLDKNAMLPVGMAWASVMLCAGIIAVLAMRANWPRAVTGALLMTAPLSNTAYVGIPVIDALTAGAATPYAIMYDQFGAFMALAVYGSIVLAVLSDDTALSVTSIVKRIVTFPPFSAIVIALLLPADALPDALTVPLGVLGWSMGPLAMFIVGSQLDLSLVPALRGPLATGIMVKLLLAPLIVLSFARGIGGDANAIVGATMQAAMPPMITAALMAISAGFSRKLTLAMVGYGTLCSLLTAPVFALLAGALR